MTNGRNNEYFEWMCRLVDNRNGTRRLSYRKLLRVLHSTEFVYIFAMDGNRAEDGIDLRYRFGIEEMNGYPCSVLEMLVALAVRCEEHIMGDPDIGDRTGQWFWGMIENLGLKAMYDAKFDKEYVDTVISQFLNRTYGRDGKGGLFTVENCRYDLRRVEIWYQMCWYLDKILGKEET